MLITTLLALLPALTSSPLPSVHPPRALSERARITAAPLPSRPLRTNAYRPIEANEFASLRSGVDSASLVIDLPTRGCVHINVVRATLVTDDFTLEHSRIVEGATLTNAVAATLPLAYEGRVAGIEASRVYLGFGSEGAQSLVAGVIEIGNESWWLSSGPVRARAAGLPAMIAHESALAPQSLAGLSCAADQLAENAADSGKNDNGEGGIAGGAGCREFRIAVDTDTEFTMAANAGDEIRASQYALLLMGAASQIYDRDLNAKLPVSYLRLWTGEDPWTQSEMVNQLYEYQAYWNANMPSLSRDLGHFLAGRGLGGGVAWLSVVCSNQNYGYGLSSGIGYGFPYPLIDHDNGNWEPMVVTHEIGHNFGAPHTHSQTPAADGCGNGDCTLAWEGTIMSYCHGCEGGMANVSLRFHPYSLASMNDHLANVSCNDAGVRAVADAASTITGVAVDVQPMLNDAFVNCTTVTLNSFNQTGSNGGTITLVDTAPGVPVTLRYTSAPGFSGNDRFVYSIRDAGGTLSSAAVNITVRQVHQQLFVDGASQGVATSWYALADGISQLPDYAAFPPYGNTVLANIDIASTNGTFSSSGRSDTVGAVFTGFIDVPTSGDWEFASESDDGSRVLIDDVLVVSNDGLHGMVNRAGLIALEAGLHRYRLEFFENGGGAGEIARWRAPGQSSSVIPASAFVHGGRVMQLDLNGDGDIGAADLAIVLGAWGSVAAGTPADFDANGAVDASDLARVLANWGQ